MPFLRPSWTGHPGTDRVSRDYGAAEPERELLGRPFLDHAPGPDRGPAPPPLAPVGAKNDIRPYLMTGGRTATADTTVAMETVVVLSSLARSGPIVRQSFERALILRESRRPCSVAELAARLRVPLGVAVVLVTDLIADNLLDASRARREQALDVEFLERLIAGVSAL